MTLRNFGLIPVFFLGLSILGAASPSTPGIDNFYQVDQQVYRGAQPTPQGFQYLSTIGVKIVIDLREHDKRAITEEQVVNADGMRYVNVPMTGMTPPTTAEMEKILALLEDATAGPVFVHCKRGADRTGAVIAAYRIDHDRWENGKALDEAMSHRMSGFQRQRQKFILTFPGKSAALAPDAAEIGEPAASAAKN